MTKLEAAADLADELHAYYFGWTLARGRVRPDEPLWGFQIIRLHDGLDTAEDPPLVITENICPHECVKEAIAKLETLDEWVASPISPRAFRVLHRTKHHDQPYTVRRLRAVAGAEERWFVHDHNDQPTIVANTEQWNKAVAACEASIAKLIEAE